jgi:diguanylate cyclase (GGDEF)-like protein
MNGNRKKIDRITIGMLINQLDGMYQAPLWRGVADTVKMADINLILFVGKSLKSPLDYEAQENIIYQLINVKRLDGIVATSSSIGNDVGYKKLVEFYKPLRSIPMVSIAYVIKGMPSILTENRLGMKEIVNHLIEVHGFRKIAIIKGPETNIEAQIRYKAYEDVLKKHDIPIDPEMVLPGDFRYESGRRAVHILLDERKRHDVQAIVSSNDDMAIIACDTLKKRGIRIPQDIAVTGFDDIEDAQYYSPPLTTVKQDLYEQGRRACQTLLAMIRDQKAAEIIKIPAKMIVRQSCGCLPIIDFTEICRQTKDQQIIGIADKEKHIKGDRVQDGVRFNKQHTKRIIDNMCSILNIPVLKRDGCKRYLSKLIDCLNSEENTSECQKDFLNQLHVILDGTGLNETVSRNWQKALAYLRFETLSSLTDSKKRNVYENLFQNAQHLPNSILVRQEAFHKLDLTRVNMTLRAIMQKINTIFSIEELMNSLAHDLPLVGIPRCFISLYNAELECGDDAKWILPKNSQLVMAYNENGILPIREKDRFFKTDALFPDFVIPKNKRFTLILNALFNRREHFGFILYELQTREEVVYIMLREIISNAIQRVLIFEKQKHTEKKLKIALNELEIVNKELHDISIQDELTGLYNRRGFFILGGQHFKLAVRTNARFLIIFADLDGLKRINDKFGHQEGDFALIIAAKMLLKTFRKSDIIARFGGDEYTVIAANDSMQQYNDIITRLNKNITRYNKQIKKPYTITLSFGVIEYDPRKQTRKSAAPSFEDLIAMADSELYKQKKSKKRIDNYI